MPLKKALKFIWIPWFFAGTGFFSVYGQKTHQIEIVNARTMEFDKSMGINAQRLKDNVVFRHQNVMMYCDSAWYYSGENKIDAFGNIYINQGDTLSLTGQFLNYDAGTRMAQIKKKVTLKDKETTLTTEKLDFDVGNSIGYYTTGGFIQNGENTLKSTYGYYYSRDKNFYFKTGVEITNPDYTILSDTLRYNTLSKTAWFFGPTHIYADSNYIYCENGWYNTEIDNSQFNKNALLKSNEQWLTGDSMYYDRKTGFGKAIRHVTIFDSTQNIILKGHYAEYYERPENALLTDSTLMIQISEGDSMFIHSDTLRSCTDTLTNESVIRAYYNVRIFKSDMQARCDSLSYTTVDSTIRLIGSPVLWSDVHQITATSIDILLKNKAVYKLLMTNFAFIVSQEDSIRYNQIRGKNMTGYFTDNQLSRIDVNGNGQTVYYPRDGENIIGTNTAESSNLVIYLKNKKVDRIKFITSPKAMLYPLDKAPPEKLILKDFKWLDEKRPKNRDDIFTPENPKSKTTEEITD